VFQSYQYFICPQNRFTLTPFQLLDCERADIFIKHVRELPEIFNYFGLYTITCSTTQLHAMVLGVFAGFIAPFGGFFASGVKRAFKIKDFGTSIPGHGGITDRMDCQLLMGTFTAVWLNSALLAATSVSGVLNQLYTFSPEEQEYILKHLMENLQNNL
jgi:phosphatidate cytidylyltransferase